MPSNDVSLRQEGLEHRSILNSGNWGTSSPEEGLLEPGARDTGDSETSGPRMLNRRKEKQLACRSVYGRVSVRSKCEKVIY